jgi:uncharacterized membrane protein
MVKRKNDFEDLISHILTFGVIFSIIFLLIGVIIYLIQTKEIVLEENWVLKGENLFMVLINIFNKIFQNNLSYTFMAIGILLLMLTQYIRVIVSVAYFSIIKDWKYIVITLIVFIILTLSIIGYFKV